MNIIMKIILIGYPGSQCIVPASKFLTNKYLNGGAVRNFDIEYLNYEGEINGWSAYVCDYLSKLTDRLIIFALDDYLVCDYLDVSVYDSAVKEVKGDVVCVKLCESTEQEHKEYPVTTQYTIWDREYLISLLKKINTPWEFEIHGSKMFDKKVLLRTCIPYFTNSSISGRWNGANLSRINPPDIIFMQSEGILPKIEIANTEFSSMDKVVVFGGSGFLGLSLIARLIAKGHRNILVVGRNEGALVALREKFPVASILVGDIVDPWIVKSAMKNAKEVYLLAAMKHVGLAETQTKSCVNSNIIGAMNVINESLETKPQVLMFISTDKAAQSNGVYGSSKKIGEKLMEEAEKINPHTKYRVIRYGNVWGSTGSIVTKWRPKLEKGEEVILTDPEASRFFWTVEEAVDLIFEAIEKSDDASPYIPKMKAIKMGVVLEACMDVYGQSPVKIIGLQPGENKVETTDGVVFSDQCEQFTKEEFIEKFLLPRLVDDLKATPILKGGVQVGTGKFVETKEAIPESYDGPKMASIISDEPKKVDIPKISCVLITRGKEYPEIVLDRLNQLFFDEIIICNESPSVYHRYLACEQAKNDIIYIQDDDCLVNYRVLFRSYNGQITNAMPLDFVKKYENTGCTLVGWGCFFPKSMLESLNRYIAKYGVDQILLREADRIFTYLNQPFNTVILPHEDLFQDEARMGMEEDHYKSMEEALEKVKNIGGFEKQ